MWLPCLMRIVSAKFVQQCVSLYVWKGPIFLGGTWSETLVPWNVESMTEVSLVII